MMFKVEFITGYDPPRPEGSKFTETMEIEGESLKAAFLKTLEVLATVEIEEDVGFLQFAIGDFGEGSQSN